MSAPATATAPQVTVREAALRLLRALRMTTVVGSPGSIELPLFLDFAAEFGAKAAEDSRRFGAITRERRIVGDRDAMA